MAWQKQQPLDEFTGEAGETQTAFNSSMDIIQRMSRIKYTIDSNLFMFDKLTAAFNIMRGYISYLYFKMTPEERKEIKEEEQSIKEDLHNAEATYNYDGKTMFKFPEIRDNVKERLIELFRVLTDIEYKKGMGMIDRDDPSMALIDG